MVGGDGHGIGGNADAFHYVFEPMTGDGQIVARLSQVGATHPMAQAGLMIRETLEADSKYVFVALTPYGVADLQYRLSEKREATSFYTTTGDHDFPCWLKLQRNGDVFTAFYSSDGWSWTPQPPVEIVFKPLEVPMRKVVYMGLAVTSHSRGILCEAAFDNVLAADSSQPDLLIRTDSEYVLTGDNVYETSAANMSEAQRKTQSIGPDMLAVYYLQLVNDGPIGDTFSVFCTGHRSGWDIRWHDPLAQTDISANVLSTTGWTTPLLLPGAWADIVLTMTAQTGVSDGDFCSVLMRAMSTSDRSQVDTASVTTQYDTSLPRAPWNRTYATDADFDEGLLLNVEHHPDLGQLQVSDEAHTGNVLPYIWVPNSNDEQDSVSKVDTRTGRELGRYRVCPRGVYGSPSRTTVDQYGNCWVGNRQCGTAVKIGLLENGQYEDRNGNGIVETSQDLNQDGVITGAEMLDWGQDECVLYEVVLIPPTRDGGAPGDYRGPYSSSPVPRALAVDANNHIWVGCFGTKAYYHIDGATGEILRDIDVSDVAIEGHPSGHTPYGAVIDANGILWSSGHSRNHVLRLDPADNSYSIVPIGHFSYGLALHKDGYLFVSGFTSGHLTRIRLADPNPTKSWPGFPNQTKGVACTDDGDVWIANADSSDGVVVRCTQEGRITARISVGSAPTGVAVDSQGYVWVVDNGDSYIHRIDPNTNEVDLPVPLPGDTRHYGYSDMTGHVLQTHTTRTGSWAVIHNTHSNDSVLGAMWWDASVPEGTSLRFGLRTSDDQRIWSSWQRLEACCAPCDVPPARYCEVKALFQGRVDKTPVLRSVTLCFEDPADCMPDHAEWVAAGQPACWCHPRQCHGDADGLTGGSDKTGRYFVGPADLNVLLSAWMVKEPPDGPGIDSVLNGICADFAHDRSGDAKTGRYHVGPTDLNVLVDHWLTKEPPRGPGISADCLGRL